MWNYIKGLFRNGSFFVKALFLGAGLFTAFVLLALIFTSGAEGFWLFFLFPTLWKKIKNPASETLRGLSTVPYWGEKFGFSNTIKLLAEDKFSRYVLKDGHVCRKVKVSKSGRWFSVAGRFYPLYLVKEYDAPMGELVMIDGHRLNCHDWIYSSEIRKALEEIFEANRIFEKDKNIRRSAISSDCAIAFRRAWGKSYEELARADWDSVRLKWEKELVEIEARTLSQKEMEKHDSGLENAFVAREAMYSRVLMDHELYTIANAIKDKKIKDTSDWWDVTRFKDELCTCNGAQLLRRVGYPSNAVGEDFLFDCLRDIQKPYFEDAVMTLSNFPKDELIERIEKYVAEAHANEDVLFGAGLIYLSKKIGYKISLAQEIEEQIAMPLAH